jgi:hypothetical protein
MLLHIWKDKGEVRIMSTVHNATMQDTQNKYGGKIKNPSVVSLTTTD